MRLYRFAISSDGLGLMPERRDVYFYEDEHLKPDSQTTLIQI